MLSGTKNHSLVEEISVFLFFRSTGPNSSLVSSWTGRPVPVSSGLKFSQLIPDLQVARVQLSLQMHCKSLVSVEGRLEGATNLANFHIFVFANKSVVNQGFQLRLLLFELFDFLEHCLGFFNFTIFSETFSLLVEKLNLLVQLVNLFMHGLLLNLVHFGRSFYLLRHSSHWSVFSPLQRPFYFLVDLTYHKFKLLNQLFLVTSLVPCVLGISRVLVLQEVVMPFIAGANIGFSVWEKVIGAER